MERDNQCSKRRQNRQISTHTLTWSVTIGYFFLIITDGYFNSHAHVERDVVIIGIFLTSIISTHTLTWSVTPRDVAHFANLKISTHTLTWSVTPSVIANIALFSISTHTLTWSVTRPLSPYGLHI